VLSLGTNGPMGNACIVIQALNNPTTTAVYSIPNA
jgi:hypothetical protein